MIYLVASPDESAIKVGGSYGVRMSLNSSIQSEGPHDCSLSEDSERVAGLGWLIFYLLYYYGLNCLFKAVLEQRGIAAVPEYLYSKFTYNSFIVNQVYLRIYPKLYTGIHL